MKDFLRDYKEYLGPLILIGALSFMEYMGWINIGEWVGHLQRILPDWPF